MKGLLLNDEVGMWDATITGKKNNTRRAHKSLREVNAAADQFKFIGIYIEGAKTYAKFKHKKKSAVHVCQARFNKGEVLYLKEPTLALKGFLDGHDEVLYRYKDHNGHSELQAFAPLVERAQAKGAKWQGKMFMAEDRARYYIRITDIKVERINDISWNDCIAEGIMQDANGLYYYTNNGVKSLHETAQKAYFSLYNLINDKMEEPNPFVFSYYFELCNKPQ